MAATLQCPICLEAIEDEAYVRPCLHFFCVSCIVTWLNKTGPGDGLSTCPICKTSVVSVVHNIRCKHATFDELLPPFNVPAPPLPSRALGRGKEQAERSQRRKRYFEDELETSGADAAIDSVAPTQQDMQAVAAPPEAPPSSSSAALPTCALGLPVASQKVLPAPSLEASTSALPGSLPAAPSPSAACAAGPRSAGAAALEPGRPDGVQHQSAGIIAEASSAVGGSSKGGPGKRAKTSANRLLRWRDTGSAWQQLLTWTGEEVRAVMEIDDVDLIVQHIMGVVQALERDPMGRRVSGSAAKLHPRQQWLAEVATSARPFLFQHAEKFAEHLRLKCSELGFGPG